MLAFLFLSPYYYLLCVGLERQATRGEEVIDEGFLHSQACHYSAVCKPWVSQLEMLLSPKPELETYCSTHCTQSCLCCHAHCCVLLPAPGRWTADRWIVEQKVLICFVLLKLGCEPGSANAACLHFVFASLRSRLSRPRAGSTGGSGAAGSCRGGWAHTALIVKAPSTPFPLPSLPICGVVCQTITGFAQSSEPGFKRRSEGGMCVEISFLTVCPFLLSFR